jgi:Sugar phosphate permease
LSDKYQDTASCPLTTDNIGENLDEAEIKLPLWKANFWFIILCLMMVLDIMDRTAVSAALPLIKKAFQLTDAQSGLVASIMGISIAVLAIPAGLLADKWSRRKICSLMVGFWSLATLLTGLAKGFPSLLAARLAVGTGEAGYGPVAYSFISAWFPKKLRGTMIGIFHASIQIGIAIGVGIAGYLTYRFGWRACFGILAIPGLILAVLAWFMPDVKAKVNRAKKANTEGKKPTSIKNMFAYALKSPALMASFFVCGFIQLSTSSLATWGASFFARTFSMNVKDAGASIAMTGLIAMFGAPLLGRIGDALIKRIENGRIIIGVVSALCFLVSISLCVQSAFHGGSFHTVFVFWALANFFLFGVPANMGTLGQDLTPSHLRAFVASFPPLFNQLIGGVGGPILVGIFSDRYGLAYGLQIICAVSVALTLIALYICIKYYHRAIEMRNNINQLSDEQI